MDLPVDIVSPSFRVGAKGRVVLPAIVRRAAHLDVGAEVVARPDGQGRVVIETVEAIRARVWAASPPAAGRDATADVRVMRDEDNRVSDEVSARRAVDFGSEADSAAAGAALLAHLGL